VFNEADNQDLRINYLLRTTTTEELKVTIQQREKKREKERALRRTMEVLVQAGSDILRRIMAEKDLDKKRAIIDEVEGLRIYINELLSKIHDRLKLSVCQYKSDWTQTYPFSQVAKRTEKRKQEEAAIRARDQAANIVAVNNIQT
jgi:thymidine kinase